MKEDQENKLKMNLRLMAPRPFGEKIGEKLFKKLMPNITKSDDLSYDLSYDGGVKIEKN